MFYTLGIAGNSSFLCMGVMSFLAFGTGITVTPSILLKQECSSSSPCTMEPSYLACEAPQLPKIWLAEQQWPLIHHPPPCQIFKPQALPAGWSCLVPPSSLGPGCTPFPHGTGSGPAYSSFLYEVRLRLDHMPFLYGARLDTFPL